MAKVKRIPLGDILIGNDAKATQVREQTNEETVKEYAARIKAGDKFPPVDLVAAPQGRYYIADGWHRVRAHIEAGKAVIEAYVHPCDKGKSPMVTAIRFALAANGGHGLRLSAGDQRNKAAVAVCLPGLSQLSDRQTAQAIGVSHQTVSRARADAVRSGKLTHRIAGCFFDVYCPSEYATQTEFRSAFGDDGELFAAIREYVKQLDADLPGDWSYDAEETQRVIHRGMRGGKAIAFSIGDNPVRNGWPTEWEPIEETEGGPARRVTDADRERWGRIAERAGRVNAARELAATASAIPTAVLSAIEEVQRYCDRAGNHVQVSRLAEALIFQNTPAREPEEF